MSTMNIAARLRSLRTRRQNSRGRRFGAAPAIIHRLDQRIEIDLFAIGLTAKDAVLAAHRLEASLELVNEGRVALLDIRHEVTVARLNIRHKDMAPVAPVGVAPIVPLVVAKIGVARTGLFGQSEILAARAPHPVTGGGERFRRHIAEILHQRLRGSACIRRQAYGFAIELDLDFTGVLLHECGEFGGLRRLPARHAFERPERLAQGFGIAGNAFGAHAAGHRRIEPADKSRRWRDGVPFHEHRQPLECHVDRGGGRLQFRQRFV